MLADRVKGWVEDWKQQGLREGREEGREEGRVIGREEGRVEATRALLRCQIVKGHLTPRDAEEQLEAMIADGIVSEAAARLIREAIADL